MSARPGSTNSEAPISEFPALIIELGEVKEDAENLIATFGETNFTPSTFPTADLIDVCVSLAELADGTVGSARVALEYARDRLAQLRKKHFNAIDQDAPADGELPETFSRKGRVDLALKELITSSVTALDECREILRIDDEDTIDLEPEIEVSPGKIGKTKKTSAKLGQALETAKKDEIFEEIEHRSIKDIKMRLADAANMNRIARAEASRPRVALQWFIKPLRLLQSYPKAIKAAGAVLEEAGILSYAATEIWLRFQRGTLGLVLDQLRQAGQDFQNVADEIAARRDERSNSSQSRNSSIPASLSEFDAWLERQIEQNGNQDQTLQYHFLTRLISQKFGMGANELAKKLTEGGITSFQKLLNSRSAFVLSKKSHIGLIIRPLKTDATDTLRLAKQALMDRAFDILHAIKPQNVIIKALYRQIVAEMPIVIETANCESDATFRTMLKSDVRFKVSIPHQTVKAV